MGRGMAQLGLGFDVQPVRSVAERFQPAPAASEEMPPPSAPAPVRSATVTRPHVLPRTGDDLPPPDVIAAELVENLHETIAIMAGLQRDLGVKDRLTPTPWVVFLDGVVGEHARCAIVNAKTRRGAELEVSIACDMPPERCFAVPAALASNVVAAVPVADHPRFCAPSAVEDGEDLCRAVRMLAEDGDDHLRRARIDAAKRRGYTDDDLGETATARFTSAMRREVRRAEQGMQATMKASADLLGCTVDELDAKIEAQRAADAAVKAERQAEGRARRLPAPRGRAAKKAPDAPAIDGGMRQLTGRQRELLGFVDVDQKTNRVVFTRDEHVPDWPALKQVVEALGGRWLPKSKKTRGGWAFPEDVDAMDVITAARERGVVLDPKLLGFYATSDELADALVAPLCIQPGERVLEPSAGDGALVRAVLRACPQALVSCVELLPENRAKLAAHGFSLIGEDILALRPEDHEPFDVVVANPPFGQGRPEIHHSLHMLRFLRPGGRMALILPDGIRFREDEATTALRAEFARHGVRYSDTEAGLFRAAGTMTRTFCAWMAKA